MKNLILYFSPTGRTQKAAEEIESVLGGEMVEIEPVKPYTDADLDWENENSRVSLEHKDPKILPEIKPLSVNPQDYDNIFIGFPIWWGEEPAVIRSFVKKYDLRGLQLYPFCTSAESPEIGADIDLSNHFPALNWHDGLRFPVDAEQIRYWYNYH